MRLTFHKYHGLGNDFALIDARLGSVEFTADRARRLCDRHTGIGADGLLLWTGSTERPRMQVINADGSVPEMCGNGIRCFIKHIADRFAPTAHTLTVETGAGSLACAIARGADGAVASVAVAMGVPSLAPAAVPIARDQPLLNESLELGGHGLRWTAVGVGNPHVVTFDAIEAAARANLAPRVGRNPMFPKGVNVEFAQILAPDAAGAPRLAVDVFERGCGWTQACGTGATATAFAAVQLGLAPSGREIAVRLPGGWLFMTVAQDGMTTMRGPATHVFDGEIELDAA